MPQMEQSPNITRLFHVRYLTLTAILLAIDVGCLLHSIDHLQAKGASMMMLFSLEVRLPS